MSPKDLPGAYFKKCTSRLRALGVLMEDKNFSDVVRESQEIVELCSKGILRLALIDPPHRHDLAAELEQSREKLGRSHNKVLDDLIVANHWLRREREMAFYGAEDFDPTEGYSVNDANRAFGYATQAVGLLGALLKAQVSSLRSQP